MKYEIQFKTSDFKIYVYSTENIDGVPFHTIQKFDKDYKLESKQMLRLDLMRGNVSND